MHKTCIFLLIFILVSVLTGCTGNAVAQTNDVTPPSVSEKIKPTTTPEVVSHNPPTSCPVTVPQDPAFIPPVPYDKLGVKGYFWYGSTTLWTAIPTDAVWYSLPHNPKGYTQKVVWWRDGYVWDKEPEPKLIVSGERLDAKAPPLNVSIANGVYASDIGSAMMVGVDIPTPGCWKITGKYKDAELSFVVWVAP